MNYKKIIKQRHIRVKLIQLLNFIPDRWMIRLQYYIKTNRHLNLRKPLRYTEKLQWMKLFYRNELMKKCVDKYEVRKYVADCGCSNILNEMYGVYNTPEEIDFDNLPSSFVIKDTLGSGGNSVIVVRDKSKIDINELRGKLWEWVNEPINKKSPGREWVYDKQKHRIIIEKFLIDENADDLPDYKFFCFDGVPYCLYMMNNYMQHHDNGRLGFLTSNFELMSVYRKEYLPMIEKPDKPERFDEMLKVASILSKEFPHVRVDLYNINGDIYFGELTFFTASGYTLFEPDQFDFELGEKFKLPAKNKKGCK